LIAYGETICRDLDAALRREWLETNGLGGFASGTICGLHTPALSRTAGGREELAFTWNHRWCAWPE
jgi:hypothetical protein